MTARAVESSDKLRDIPDKPEIVESQSEFSVISIVRIFCSIVQMQGGHGFGGEGIYGNLQFPHLLLFQGFNPATI